MPYTGGSSNNNSTSSRFGFGGSQRNQSSSAFEFGGATSSRFNSSKQDSPLTEKSFNFNTGLTSSATDNSFSPRRARFDNDQNREIGSIKRWTGERGFGFIRRANGGPDLFCHIRSLKDGIQTLEEVNTYQLKYQN